MNVQGRFKIFGKVLKQIGKEFWFPLGIAITWSYYEYTDINSLIKSFSTSFFLAAWATGQINRIRKQQKVESNFSKISGLSLELLQKLKSTSEDLAGFTTGKGSYPKIVPSYHRNVNHFVPSISANGKYPVFDLKYRIVNLQQPIKVPTLQELNADQIKLGDLHPEFPLPQFPNCPLDPDILNRFNIFYETRSGKFSELLRLIKVDENWEYGFRILGSNGRDIVEEYFTEKFPSEYRNENFK